MRAITAQWVFFVLVSVFILLPASAASTPAASFVVNATSGTIPCGIQFIDTSTNSPTAWVWSFGDGGTSSEQNPSHEYTNAGTFTVTLTATNAAGSDTVTKTGYIAATKSTPAPTAAFVSNSTSGTASFAVQFVDASTYSPTGWAWSFGDGSTSAEQNPSHTYTSAGTYTVTLTATNAAGSNTVTKTGFITVSASSSVPAASFVTTVTSGTVPLAVQFVDTSTNSPTAWVWSFGDGSTSSEKNPSHTYTTAGTYTVTLTVTNTGGSNTVTQSGIITAYYAVPVVGFTANRTSGTAPVAVGFTDTSSNSPTSWYWYFGDGGTSTVQNPEYSYSDSSVYSVSLTATNSAGSNTTTQSGLITVTAITSPAVSFTSDVTTGTVPVTVQFTDTSSYSPTGWQWSFGDGASSTVQNPTHTYTTAGTYTVLLSASNAGGSRTKTVNDYIVVSAQSLTTTIPTTIPVTATATPAPTVTSTAVTPAAVAVNQTAPASEDSSGLLPYVGIGFAILICIGIVLVKRNPPRGGSRRSRGREL
ncbi:PKD domain-containing protein [uncultured Methanoregula sp.]|uniref:PKD domain-containing protein n=1 Tax=uncultured Methanoregula sp. TaxID=1005933 RepID=UPI002AAB6474|nr:PKD domain-containing protein [uncultured Methanoregula sp.]